MVGTIVFFTKYLVVRAILIDMTWDARECSPHDATNTRTNMCKHIMLRRLYSLMVLSNKSRKQPTISPSLYLAPKDSSPLKWTLMAYRTASASHSLMSTSHSNYPHRSYLSLRESKIPSIVLMGLELGAFCTKSAPLISELILYHESTDNWITQQNISKADWQEVQFHTKYAK